MENIEDSKENIEYWIDLKMMKVENGYIAFNQDGMITVRNDKEKILEDVSKGWTENNVDLLRNVKDLRSTDEEDLYLYDRADPLLRAVDKKLSEYRLHKKVFRVENGEVVLDFQKNCVFVYEAE
jgi:hypothetical protein